MKQKFKKARGFKKNPGFFLSFDSELKFTQYFNLYGKNSTLFKIREGDILYLFEIYWWEIIEVLKKYWRSNNKIHSPKNVHLGAVESWWRKNNNFILAMKKLRVKKPFSVNYNKQTAKWRNFLQSRCRPNSTWLFLVGDQC